MNLLRRGARTAVVLAAVSTLSFGAFAQDSYPNKPVNVIIPFAAGGTADILGRIFAERLSQRLGQQFVVENRTGAGGNTGMNGVAKAAPDGYTLGIGPVTMAINPHIYKDKMPFDPIKDLKPLMLMVTQPNIIVVHPSVPAKTLPELIAYLKANPDKESFATSGVGTSLHLCMEMFMQRTDTKMAHVPYRASNQVMQDVIGGQVNIACDNASSALPQVQAYKVRGIAVTGPKRMADAPDLPTVAETLSGFEAVTWHSWIAPAALPESIAAKLMGELTAIFREPEVQKRLRDLSTEPSGLAGDAFGAFIKSEVDKWGETITKAGIKAQ